MNTPCQCGAQVWPISHTSRSGRSHLDQVVVTSDHADGSGAIHLSTDQALYIQSRLSQIAITYLPHHHWDGRHPHDQPTTHPAGLPARPIPHCGAEAWPVLSDDLALPMDMEKVIVISEHDDGRGAVQLSPDQVLCIEERLSRISLDFLHDTGWGGEDAGSQ